MPPTTSAIEILWNVGMLFAQECVKYALEKIADASSGRFFKKPAVSTLSRDFNYEDAWMYYDRAQIQKAGGNETEARKSYYKVLDKLKQSRRDRHRERAHINLCIAEIWLAQNDDMQALTCCDDALQLLENRPRKYDLPQFARAFHLKCSALTCHSPKDALPFGLLAYGIESYCYAGGSHEIAYEASLKTAWLKAGGQSESDFEPWRSKELEKAIKQGKLQRP